MFKQDNLNKCAVVHCKITLSSWILVSAFAFGIGGVAPAHADGLVVNEGSMVRLAQATFPPSAVAPPGSTTIPAPNVSGPTNPFALADRYKLKGWAIPVPGAADTVDGGLGGLRNTLAEAGVSYLGIENAFFADNLIRHAHPLGNRRDQQQYNGQLPTRISLTYGYLFYDLSRYGVPDGQLAIAGVLLATNWDPLGPNSVALSSATYYQTLLDKRVEVKFGYLNNTLEYLGTQVGGSLAGGVFGPSASLLVEQGANQSTEPTPGINVKVNFPQNFYTKFGMARGLSPDGTVAEQNQNRSGVRFKVANSGLFAIDETGYRVPASPGQMQTWLRAAATYDSGRYAELTNPTIRHSNNFGGFLLADRQLLQTAPNAAPGSAVRGIYAGVSAEYVPPSFNRFSQYYEARLYGFGLIPGRPFDLASLVATETVFSGQAVALARRRGLTTHRDTQALTTSYSAHVLPGININTAINWTTNPTVITYSSNTGSALNLLIGTVIFF